MEFSTDILIIGAGMAGLSAARRLQEQGKRVLVLDKGRGAGGRLAGRRFDGAVFDHGAQFATARDPRFKELMEEWRRAGAVKAWYNLHEGQREPQTRWRGEPAMTALAKQLAHGLEVRLQTRLEILTPAGEGWKASTGQGDVITARAVVLTPPVPQSLALLASSGMDLLPAQAQALGAITYERCLAVMALLAGPSQLPEPGGLALSSGPVAWIADNQMKGLSAKPAVTLHATAAYSTTRWDADRNDAAQELLEAAAPWIGSPAVRVQVHGWRYSRPQRTQPHACEVLEGYPPLVFAGDAFGGPRVEGAVLSGWAAAEVLQTLVLRSG